MGDAADLEEDMNFDAWLDSLPRPKRIAKVRGLEAAAKAGSNALGPSLMEALIAHTQDGNGHT